MLLQRRQHAARDGAGTLAQAKHLRNRPRIHFEQPLTCGHFHSIARQATQTAADGRANLNVIERPENLARSHRLTQFGARLPTARGIGNRETFPRNAGKRSRTTRPLRGRLVTQYPTHRVAPLRLHRHVTIHSRRISRSQPDSKVCHRPQVTHGAVTMHDGIDHHIEAQCHQHFIFRQRDDGNGARGRPTCADVIDSALQPRLDSVEHCNICKQRIDECHAATHVRGAWPLADQYLKVLAEQQMRDGGPDIATTEDQRAAMRKSLRGITVAVMLSGGHHSLRLGPL